MAGPVLAGSSQLTVRPLSVSSLTVGGSGLPGGSFTSATLMVNVTLSLKPPGFVAVTMTSYELRVS